MSPRYSLLNAEEQRALYELFIFAERADGRISLAEQEAVLMLLDAMGFTSDDARDFYKDAVQTRVAAAAASTDGRRARLTALCGRFATPESRRIAVAAIAALGAADGDTADAGEKAFLAELSGLLRH